jgi:hypothetical protein
LCLSHKKICIVNWSGMSESGTFKISKISRPINILLYDINLQYVYCTCHWRLHKQSANKLIHKSQARTTNTTSVQHIEEMCKMKYSFSNNTKNHNVCNSNCKYKLVKHLLMQNTNIKYYFTSLNFKLMFANSSQLFLEICYIVVRSCLITPYHE